MTATSTEIDPFAGSTSTPSLSFKDATVGTVYEGVVTEAPTLVQSRDFETGEPAYWPVKRPGETPNPKMSVVLKLEVDGEERSVWAQKPSALFAAIGEAQKVAGKRIEVGGTLAIKYTGDKPNDNPRLNAAKQYAAKYTPPAAVAGADPWAADAAPAAPAAPAKPAATDAPPF